MAEVSFSTEVEALKLSGELLPEAQNSSTSRVGEAVEHGASAARSLMRRFGIAPSVYEDLDDEIEADKPACDDVRLWMAYVRLQARVKYYQLVGADKGPLRAAAQEAQAFEGDLRLNPAMLSQYSASTGLAEVTTHVTREGSSRSDYVMSQIPDPYDPGEWGF